jgi:putative transposase
VEVWHDEKFVARATPLDAYANCFVRRHRPTRNIDPDTAPAAPRMTGLAFRDLSARTPKDKEPR